MSMIGALFAFQDPDCLSRVTLLYPAVLHGWLKCIECICGLKQLVWPIRSQFGLATGSIYEEFREKSV